MGLFDWIFAVQNPSTPEEIESSAAYIGGDPVMASAGLGHDYAQTVHAQEAVAAVETRKGAALSPAELATVLANHPGADRDLATAGAQTQAPTVRAIKQAAASAAAGLLGWLARFGAIVKWASIALVVVVVVVVAHRVKKAVWG